MKSQPNTLARERTSATVALHRSHLDVDKCFVWKSNKITFAQFQVAEDQSSEINWKKQGNKQIGLHWLRK